MSKPINKTNTATVIVGRVDEYVMIKIGPVELAMPQDAAQKFAEGILGAVASIRGVECFLFTMGTEAPQRIEPVAYTSPEGTITPIKDRPRPKPKTRWKR